jgi:glutathione S-transferase
MRHAEKVRLAKSIARTGTRGVRRNRAGERWTAGVGQHSGCAAIGRHRQFVRCPDQHLGRDGGWQPLRKDDVSASGRGWGKRADALAAIDAAVGDGTWLLGARFTAADVMLGGLLSIALVNHRIVEPPDALIAYDRRLSARPAHRRAA